MLNLTKEYLEEEYYNKGRSWGEIAKDFGTYPNKIKRHAAKLGIKSKSQSQAQSDALSRGVRKHPTKGTKRAESTKLAISEKNHQAWESLTEEEREARSQLGKELWAKRDQHEITAMHNKARESIRKASREGSHLEKFLHQEIIQAGYKNVLFHQEHYFVNQKLQIDILMPSMSVAIEVDGPSHDKPVWGEKSLARNRRADSEKSSLLLSRDFVFIRVKQNKRLSQKFKRDISAKLLSTLKNIESHFPDRENRYIELSVGEDNEQAA